LVKDNSQISYLITNDNLGEMLTAVVIATQAFCFQQVFQTTGDTPITPNRPIVLEGRYSGVEIFFMSAGADKIVSALNAPIPIEIHCRPLTLNREPLAGKSNVLTRFVDSLFELYFVSYFEKYRSSFAIKFGSNDAATWDPEYRLRYVMRNRIAHGENATKLGRLFPIRWNGFTVDQYELNRASPQKFLNGVDLFYLSRELLAKLAADECLHN
jgi:hypothetical protein